jgi:hypothetical protein
LVDLDGEPFGPEEADMLDAVRDDLRAGPMLEIGFAVKVTMGVPAQAHKRRVVAGGAPSRFVEPGLRVTNRFQMQLVLGARNSKRRP